MTRLLGLDALRGIAALCVVVFHIFSADGPPNKGYLAVDFFFMLSGYVMARTYEDRLGERGQAIRFLVKRYRRLFPTMLVGTLIGAVLLGPWSSGQLIAGVLLIPLFVSGISAFPLNSPAWSASVEFILNIFHGLIFTRLSIGPLVALSIAASVFTLASLPANYGIDRGPWGGELLWGIFRGLISYPIGIVLWRIWKDNPPIEVPSFVTFLAMPVLMLASAPVAKGYPVIDLAFICLVCPLLIAGGLATKPRWGEFAGAISFPLYAIHYPIMDWAGDDWRARFAAAALAILLCCLYEIFGRKFVSRLKFSA